MKQPNHQLKYTLVALLLASLTTTQILSVVYSKYTTGTEIISDSARVAKYDVVITDVSGEMPNIRDEGGNPLKPLTKPGEEVTEEVTLGSGDVNLDAAGKPDDPNDPDDPYDKNISGGAITNTVSFAKTYEIANNSEVAVAFKVIVELDKALPKGTKMTMSMTTLFEDEIEWTVRPAEDGNTYTFSSPEFAIEPGATRYAQLIFTTDNTNSAAVTDLSGVCVSVDINVEQID